MTWYTNGNIHTLRQNTLLCGEVRPYKGRWSAFVNLGDGKNLGEFDTLNEAKDATANAVSMATGWTWSPQT